MQLKIGSILSIAGLITVSMTGLSTPAAAQSTQACRDACKFLYPGGRSDPEYLDCVEICSQGTGGNPHIASGLGYGPNYLPVRTTSFRH